MSRRLVNGIGGTVMGAHTTERHRAMNLLTKLASDVRERTEQLKIREYAMTEAVASAIGCPEWFDLSGCDGSGECYCLNAARAVEKVLRGQP
jgi:hypothetical protein